jgi:hypothetical protein
MRARSTSPRLTLDHAVEIHRRLWLGEAQHQIAAAFQMNQGRISEVATGRRFPEAKAIAMGRKPS